MKKALSLIVCVVVLIGVLAMSVFAADNNQITITADKAEALPGEEVVFTVTMESTNACELIGIILDFDTDVFEFVEGKATASYEDEDEVQQVFFQDFRTDPGQEGIAVSFKTPVVYNGKLGKFTLRVKDTADFTKTTVGIREVSAMNGYDNVPADVVSAEVAKHEHTWVNHEAVEPTCDMDGNIAYQQCSGCGAAQTWDENPMPLSLYGWVLGATGHTWVNYEAVAPTCEMDGNIAYQQCSVCGAAQTWEENPMPLGRYGWVVAATGHTFENHEAVAPTCDMEGNIAYQQCTVCGYAQTWEENPVPLSRYGWVLGATGHTWVNYEAVAPTCDMDGNIAYQQCSTCGAAQTWEENPMPLGRYGWVVAATGHTFENHEAVAPTCDMEGNIAYQQCTVCGYAQTWEENPVPLSRYGWVLGATGHTWVNHEAVAPTCDMDGNIAYQQCSVCGAAQTWEENPMPLGRYGWVVAATGHTWVNYEAVAATCETDGNIAYQQCSTCGAAQTWEENPMPLGRYGWVVVATGHTYVQGFCSSCGVVDPDYIFGDINGDGDVTNADVVKLMWHVLFPAQNPVDAYTDFSGDGENTNADVIKLMWYILFPNDHPLITVEG